MIYGKTKLSYKYRINCHSLNHFCNFCLSFRLLHISHCTIFVSGRPAPSRTPEIMKKKKRKEKTIENCLFQINSSSFKLFSTHEKMCASSFLSFFFSFFNISYFHFLFCHTIIVNILRCCTSKKETEKRIYSVIFYKRKYASDVYLAIWV